MEGRGSLLKRGSKKRKEIDLLLVNTIKADSFKHVCSSGARRPKEQEHLQQNGLTAIRILQIQNDCLGEKISKTEHKHSLNP